MARIVRQFAALAVLALLAGCAAEPPYFGPSGPDHPTGYTDQQIDKNRFRVSYQGNSQTPRTTVENFLLLRSAQVALQAGYPYFEFDTRDTKSKTTYFSTFTGWPGWGGYGRFGWSGWGWGPDFPDDTTTVPITRYEAYAEIVLLTEAQGHGDPRALDAKSVIDHLGPLAMPPPPNG
jgi:hypothetical protein